MKHIAAHVHCRDEEEAYKTTILWTTAIARIQGFIAVFDMPNTKPPILTKKDIERRFRVVKEKGCSVDYRVFVGLTSDPVQIKEAVEIVNTDSRGVGLKLYPKPEEEEKEIYKTLAALNYQGVLAKHCEKESLFRSELWDPQKPWTHSLARPPEAEIESIKDQIRFAQEFNFTGHLHICHATLPKSFDLVLEAKKIMRISAAVTPHHLLFSEEEMKREEVGLLYKVNPPLRDAQSVEKLREYLKQGKIDWIELDHAPHTKKDKLESPYSSGIANLGWWIEFLIWLEAIGITKKQIEDLTYWNIKRVFGEKLKLIR